ncbi:MAG: hypothetical protein GY842_01050 [bacterium]|nr:hypothetical protein [bacterium]
MDRLTWAEPGTTSPIRKLLRILAAVFQAGFMSDNGTLFETGPSSSVGIQPIVLVMV